jgi:hypothetical protein
VKHWMTNVLDILKDHLAEAKAVAVSMGIKGEYQPMVQDSTSQ